MRETRNSCLPWVFSFAKLLGQLKRERRRRGREVFIMPCFRGGGGGKPVFYPPDKHFFGTFFLRNCVMMCQVISPAPPSKQRPGLFQSLKRKILYGNTLVPHAQFKSLCVLDHWYSFFCKNNNSTTMYYPWGSLGSSIGASLDSTEGEKEGGHGTKRAWSLESRSSFLLLLLLCSGDVTGFFRGTPHTRAGSAGTGCDSESATINGIFFPF